MVWSFGYVFSLEVIHYWSEYAQKKKKKNKTKNIKDNAFFIVPFSIDYMYGCAGLLHWVCVLKIVHMGVSFWDFILVYIWVRVWVVHSIFVRGEQPFFRIFGFLPYSSLHPFLCDYFPCLDAGWPSLTFLSFCLLLSLFYSFISLYLIWFLSFIILLDVWLGFYRTSGAINSPKSNCL